MARFWPSNSRNKDPDMAMAQQQTTVVGVFEDRGAADQAIGELMKAGFREDQIGVVMRHEEGDIAGTVDSDADDSEGSHAGSGMTAGALTGLGLGALAGVGVLAGVIPVIGPAIAAGTLGVILSNAAAGAGIAGLIGALVGAGIPEEEAKYYNEEFEAGRTIVTVNADGRVDEAMAVMRRHGAYDTSNRSQVTSAATGSSERSSTAAASSRSRSAKSGSTGDTIEVKEERLRAEKQPVNAGEVKVRKDVRTETQTLEVPVRKEEVVIERTPVHGHVPTDRSATGDIREGEEIRIPVREERVNVSKDTVVKEEVKVGKRTVQDTKKVSGQVRKEELKVDKSGDVDVEACDR